MSTLGVDTTENAHNDKSDSVCTGSYFGGTRTDSINKLNSFIFK